MWREEARKRFKKIGASRANRVIKDLALLSNCGDRKHYEYDHEQVNTIFKAIESALEQSKSRFKPKGVKEIRL